MTAEPFRQTYLFYDTETTGLNCCFDQLLQFAAIRTDLNLNELERHEFFVRLKPDVIPSPSATLTHRIGISKTQQGLDEWQALRQIHHLFNHPGTISVGYNSLGFDDEVLRFSFYRNLLPPYTHQYANGCGRMDIYPLILMYYLYKPSVLEWPKRQDKTSLKLEDLNATNGLYEGNAHDAMVDVCITLELAKRLKKEERMWHYVAGYFNKEIDNKRLRNLDIGMRFGQQSLREGLLIHGALGPKLRYLAPVLQIGQHNLYKNQTLWLRLDAPELSQVTEKTFPNHHNLVFKRKPGEQQILLPNQAHYARHIAEKRQQQVLSNKLWLLANPKLFATLSDYFLNYKYPKIERLDLDAKLYDLPFPNDADIRIAAAIQEALAQEKQFDLSVCRNPTQRLQAERLLARHFQHRAPETVKKEFQSHLHCIYHAPAEHQPLDYRGQNRFCAEKALQEIQELRKNQTLDEGQLELLAELENYILTQKAVYTQAAQIF